MAVRVQREKVEQAHGVQLLRTLGAKVYVHGTHRKRDDFQGTMQTPGTPDIEAWLPAPRIVPRPHAAQLRWLLKWEVKAAGGRLSPEQREYQELCNDADVEYLVGDYNALVSWLIESGYLSSANVPHYRVPPLRQTKP